jgi:acyl dehydratase
MTRPAQITWHEAASLEVGAVLHHVDLPAVTSTQLAFYCAAVKVADPIHYDRDFAMRFGFPNLVVNGSLRISWLTRALADLVSAPDYVSAIKCAHRGPMFAGDAMSLQVVVSAAALATDGGYELPCQVTGKVDGKIVDQADGMLFLGQRQKGE